MKALLVIDIQIGLTKCKTLFEEKLFLETVNNTIMQFKVRERPVIFVQHNSKTLQYDTNDWEIDPRIEKDILDYTIQKDFADAFKNTILRTLLDDLGVTEVYICGLAWNSSVKLTCIGGVINGFKTYLIKNGHTSWHQNAHELIRLTEDEIKTIGAELIASQQIFQNDSKQL